MASDPTNLYIFYVPNQAAAIAGAVVFGVLLCLHIWQIFKSRQWFGLGTLAGGAFEFVGLAARAYSHDRLSELALYIIQALTILLAPILFAASIYMYLGRLIRRSGHPKLSLIRLNWLTKIFVFGDIFCFLAQSSGAGRLVNAKDAAAISSAQDTIRGGLGLQVLVFGIFALCAVVFHVRISKEPASRVDPTLRLNLMLASLYLASFLVTVRNIYRLVEYGEDAEGYLRTHEWPGYVLDVMLMAVIMAISFFWYSSLNGSTYLKDHGADLPLRHRNERV